MLETVKTLCALPGVSGWEDEVRSYISECVADLPDRIETDAIGNLYVWKKGIKSLGRPVMLCAHMDEVGLIITGFHTDGSLRFQFVGGVDRRVVLGKRVSIGPDRISGVIGMKAAHLLRAGEGERVPALDELYVDIGAESAEEARAIVEPGWRGVFHERVEEFGGGFLKAKALDDRVGCATLLTLLRQQLPVDVCCVFTVQEEVGCRGAQTAAERVRPETALVLEGTTAADIGGVAERKQVCRLGHGVVIPFMDGGTIYDHSFFRQVTATAERRCIPWQTKEMVAGGTDASAIQRHGAGARVITMSAPLRSIHSPASVGKISDILAMPVLCRAVLEDLADGVYDI